jgi:hypothetical protein
MADSNVTQIGDAKARCAGAELSYKQVEDATEQANDLVATISEIHAQSWALFDLISAYEDDYATDDDQGEMIVRLRHLSSILRDQLDAAKGRTSNLHMTAKRLLAAVDTPGADTGEEAAELAHPNTVSASDSESEVLKKMQSAVELMDCRSQESLGDIESIALIAAASLDNLHPNQAREHVGRALRAIAHKAMETMNEINCDAERVGCNYKEDREVTHG